MSSSGEKADTLLVTGASGHLGRRVLANLLDTCGIPPSCLIAVTRDPAKVADIAARGVDVRRGDFDDPASLDAAFKGANRLLLISTDAFDRPGARIAQHKAAIAAAKQAGVKHIVYTSMPRPDGSPIPFAPDHLGTEQALAASGLGWTVLRNAWYFENLALSLPDALATGKCTRPPVMAAQPTSHARIVLALPRTYSRVRSPQTGSSISLVRPH